MATCILRLLGYENEAVVCYVLFLLAYFINLQGSMLVFSGNGFDVVWEKSFVDYIGIAFLVELGLAWCIYSVKKHEKDIVQFSSFFW